MTAAGQPLAGAGRRPAPVWAGRAALAVLVALLLFGAFHLYRAGQPLFGLVLTALACGVALVFGSRRFYGARFIFPGAAAVLVFIAFPVLFTIYLGFTNYSSFNLLTQPRATEVLLARSTVDAASETPFAVVPEDGGYRVWLPEMGLLSAPVALDGPATADLQPAPPPEATLSRREAIALRGGLQELTLRAPDGTELRNAGLRTFARVTPAYERIDADTLRRTADGALLRANPETGFYETAAGERVPPGWRVTVGLDNFRTLLRSEGIRAPMLAIFAWTVVFAAVTVAATFAIGLLLAVILQWEHLRFSAAYRVLLILPYAVPAFISILVFRGLFNQNFGEINLILQALFGIRPDWFTDGTLARIMVLIVNVWLGYPYMMLLAMGFLKAVPEEHKKAAALEGASPARVFFSITLPQIVPPFLPLLIASFAFNFNNLMLILLLTRGGPDMPGTLVPAGETDILASFTYRIAFLDSGQQFGLAGAITLVIFAIVALISYGNFVVMRRAAVRKGPGR